MLVIPEMRRRYPGTMVGLSDHFNGIAMSLAAYMLGARIVEKHFTLNRSWKGTDHALSLEPAGMRKLVRDLRRARLAMGSTEKQVLDKEVGAITKMGKALFAARALPVGHVLTDEDIVIRSPGGGGLPPYELERVIGMTVVAPLQEEQALTLQHLRSAESQSEPARRSRDAASLIAR